MIGSRPGCWDVRRCTRLPIRLATPEYARQIVGLLRDSQAIPEAINLLSREGYPSSYLLWGLGRIMSGMPLHDQDALQSFANNIEPFFNSASFMRAFQRVSRTVCAIGLDTPLDPIKSSLKGSGFLVGPDLVMTNSHVVNRFLDIAEDGTVTQNTDGDQLFCFFDYVSMPPPQVPPNGKHASIAVRGAKQWLVHGRRFLADDGTQHCRTQITDEFDYVVIRLAEPVGSRPAQRGMGVPRGWLPLPRQVDQTLGRRVVIHQHPESAPQQFDIGEYHGPDTDFNPGMVPGVHGERLFRRRRGGQRGPALRSSQCRG